MKDQWLDRKYILTGAMNMFCKTRRIIIVQPCRLAVTRALPELNYQQLRRCRRPSAISLSPLDNAKVQSLEQGIEKKDVGVKKRDPPRECNCNEEKAVSANDAEEGCHECPEGRCQGISYRKKR
jgi:hypothetical protein